MYFQAWTLKYSDPSREGRFLDIPLHYGDWVPIDHAKALVEKVASRFTQEGLGTPAAPAHPALHPDPVLVVSLLSPAHVDGLSGQTSVSQAQGRSGATVQHWLHAALTLAVVAPLQTEDNLD